MVDTQKKVLDFQHLNLARKWRSKNFDEIIGQDIAVRMLKNSLYIGQFFPVYLFSGQRGCGKTSMARIFAAAVNCEQLPFFRQDPQRISLPCAVCTSCKALFAGKHPDCIEIDAASHTGVDHVRQIIDASSLLPLLGSKKIYVIDEAHMLSKAAFNAFLKILEEPPASVLFILATTDPEKILETVRSRCFQVIFRPVEQHVLVKHLQHVCAAENIAYESEALTIIAQESEGAVRDALNIIEQVRFAHEKITKDAVFDVLGHLDDERLLQLFDALLNKPCAEFAHVYAHVVAERVSPTFLWQACIELFRASLSCIHAVPLVRFAHLQARIQALIRKHEATLFIGLMRLLYEHEMIFLKTATPHAFLLMTLLQASQYVHAERNPSSSLTSPAEPNAFPKNKGDAVKKTVVQSKVDTKGQDPNSPDAAWSLFLHKVDMLDDPLIASILKQGHLAHFDAQTGKLTAAFPRDFAMFEDMLMQAKKGWQPLLDEAFKTTVSCVMLYQEQEPKEPKKPDIKKSFEPPVVRTKTGIKQPEKVTTLDVSDKEMWEKTNVVLEFFPGTVTELRGEEDVAL